MFLILFNFANIYFSYCFHIMCSNDDLVTQFGQMLGSLTIIGPTNRTLEGLVYDALCVLRTDLGKGDNSIQLLMMGFSLNTFLNDLKMGMRNSVLDY